MLFHQRAYGGGFWENVKARHEIKKMSRDIDMLWGLRRRLIK